MTYNKGTISLFITYFVTQDFVRKILLQTISILCCNMYTCTYIIIFVTELFLTHTVTNVYYSIKNYFYFYFLKSFIHYCYLMLQKIFSVIWARHCFGKELKALKILKLITCPSSKYLYDFKIKHLIQVLLNIHETIDLIEIIAYN